MRCMFKLRPLWSLVSGQWSLTLVYSFEEVAEAVNETYLICLGNSLMDVL